MNRRQVNWFWNKIKSPSLFSFHDAGRGILHHFPGILNLHVILFW